METERQTDRVVDSPRRVWVSHIQRPNPLFHNTPTTHTTRSELPYEGPSAAPTIDAPPLNLLPPLRPGGPTAASQVLRRKVTFTDPKQPRKQPQTPLSSSGPVLSSSQGGGNNVSSSPSSSRARAEGAAAAAAGGGLPVGAEAQQGAGEGDGETYASPTANAVAMGGALLVFLFINLFLRILSRPPPN